MKPDIYDRDKTLSVLGKHGLKTQSLDVWVKKFTNLRWNAKRREIDCDLTLSQYVGLAVKAGLTEPSQIGKRSGEYQVGRRGDCGAYSKANCRFITEFDNKREKTKNGGDSVVAEKLSRPFVIRAPSGRVYRGSNLRRFARVHELNWGNLSSVFNGVRGHHKGWTGRYTD